MVCSETSIRYIRVEHNGFPDHAGDNLVNCYDTAEKIDKLLSLGNLSNIEGTARQCIRYHEPEGNLNFAPDQWADAFKQLLHEEIVDYGYLFVDADWKCWDYSGDEIDLGQAIQPNPLDEAQGLLRYVVSQAESMKQAASSPGYSYKNADCHLGVHLQNIQSACGDISSLLEECKAMREV
jgi:hypothetical protein